MEGNMSLKQVYIDFDTWLVSQGVSDVVVEYSRHYDFFDDNELSNVNGHNARFTLANGNYNLKITHNDVVVPEMEEMFSTIFAKHIKPKVDDLRPISNRVYHIGNKLFFVHEDELIMYNAVTYRDNFEILVGIMNRNYQYTSVRVIDEPNDYTITYKGKHYSVNSDSIPGIVVKYVAIDDNGYTMPFFDELKHYLENNNSPSGSNRQDIYELRNLFRNSASLYLKDEVVIEKVKSYVSDKDIFVVTKGEHFKAINSLHIKIDEGLIFWDEKSKYFSAKRGIKFSRYKNSDDVVTLNGSTEIVDNLKHLDEMGLTRVVDDYLRHSRRVNDYSFRPNNNLKMYNGELHDYNDSKKYFGVEIEIDEGGNSNQNAQIILQTLTKGVPSAYVTRDGSLSNGFELKTIPVGYDDAINLDWDEALSIADDLGYTGENNTCGIHIHVSKKWFLDVRNRLNIFKYNNNVDDTVLSTIVHIMHRIMQNNWADILKFTRRDYDKLRQWANDKGVQRANETHELLKNKDDKFFSRALDEFYVTSNEKYRSINVRKNETIEFRIFRGTINPNELRDIVKFVHNITNIGKTFTQELINTVKENEVWVDIAERIDAVTMEDLLKEVE